MTVSEIIARIITIAAETTVAASDDEEDENKSMHHPWMKNKNDLTVVGIFRDFVLRYPATSSTDICSAFYSAHKDGDFIAADAITMHQQKVWTSVFVDALMHFDIMYKLSISRVQH